MYDSVRDAFIRVTAPLEGKVNHMHCDEERRVVTGIGILLPDAASAQRLGWRWRDTNKRATAKEIAADWNAIRVLGQQGPPNRGSIYYRQYAQLMLPDIEITRSAMDRLNWVEMEVEEKFPKTYRNWPAHAQMAVLQLVWSDTLNVDVITALEKENWLEAVIAIKEGTHRGEYVRHLFLNAHKVEENGLIKSSLHEPSFGNPLK